MPWMSPPSRAIAPFGRPMCELSWNFLNRRPGGLGGKDRKAATQSVWVGSRNSAVKSLANLATRIGWPPAARGETRRPRTAGGRPDTLQNLDDTDGDEGVDGSPF